MRAASHGEAGERDEREIELGHLFPIDLKAARSAKTMPIRRTIAQFSGVGISHRAPTRWAAKTEEARANGEAEDRRTRHGKP